MKTQLEDDLDQLKRNPAIRRQYNLMVLELRIIRTWAAFDGPKGNLNYYDVMVACDKALKRFKPCS